MINPFFDPTEMTNKEINQKIDEISERIMMAQKCGIPYEAIQQMRGVINLCSEELYSRSEHKNYEEMKEESPCVFQSDDATDIPQAEKKAKNETTRKPITRPEW